MANAAEQLKLTAYTPGEGGETFILEPGKYAVELSEVKLVEQMNFEKTAKEKKFQFTWKTLKPVAEGDEEATPETIGKHGIITCWPNAVGYQLAPPKQGSPAALTVLIDQIFGRKLTKDESENLSIGRLTGIRGFAMVVPGNGVGKKKWGSFILPKTMKYDPSDFKHEGETVSIDDVVPDEDQTIPRDKKAKADGGPAFPGEDGEETIEDPFADDK